MLAMMICIEKGGVLWSPERTTIQDRLRAINIMKSKPGSVTAIQTMMDAFKLFFTDEILNCESFRTSGSYHRVHSEKKS